MKVSGRAQDEGKRDSPAISKTPPLGGVFLRRLDASVVDIVDSSSFTAADFNVSENGRFQNWTTEVASGLSIYIASAYFDWIAPKRSHTARLT